MDLLIEVGAVLVAFQFLTPIFRSIHKRLYVSLWYFSAGFIWLILTHVMGNNLSEWVLLGSSGAATVGLFVTPMGWGLMHFFVPIIPRKPIWSHALSVIGFWALAFFYPLNGGHHFLLSSIPMSVQYGAVISTIAVEIVVITVVVNFFATMRGSAHVLRTNLPIRWFYTGIGARWRGLFPRILLAVRVQPQCMPGGALLPFRHIEGPGGHRFRQAAQCVYRV